MLEFMEKRRKQAWDGVSGIIVGNLSWEVLHGYMEIALQMKEKPWLC
jgi:hypothetical protein